MGKKLFPFFLFWNMIQKQPVCAFYSVIVTGLLVTPYYLLYLVWKSLIKNDKTDKNKKDVKALPSIIENTLDKTKNLEKETKGSYQTIYDEINNYE